MIREVLEESGFSIQNPRYCGLLMFPKFKGNDWYVFVFTANEFTGELIESPEGRLEWIQDGKLFSAKFEYDGDEMCRYSVVFHS